jgi:hypothetical protein
MSDTSGTNGTNGGGNGAQDRPQHHGHAAGHEHRHGTVAGAGPAMASLPEDDEPDTHVPVPRDLPTEPTIHRTPLGPAAARKAPPEPQSWFSRHWIITLAGGVLLLLIAASLYVSHGMY